MMSKYVLTYGNSDNLPWTLPFGFVKEVLTRFPAQVFSTVEFINQWKRVDPIAVKDYEEMRGRNWRAIVGKLLKQYMIETSKIIQITPPGVSPARWRRQ
jgi:hypothetical protein